MYKFLRIALGVVCLLICGCLLAAQQSQKIKISYVGHAGASWPLYVAKGGGYYAKYGLDVDLVAADPSGIPMVVSGEALVTMDTLDQAMKASSKDGSLIAYASQAKKSLFAMMVRKEITSVRELKGKTIGLTPRSGAQYNYAVGILAKNGLSPTDVVWLDLESKEDECVAALAGGRIDAAMIEAPASFKLEEQGFKSLANISDIEDIYAPTVLVFKKMKVATNPHLPELLIRAHSEAIKRFYSDKAFAVKSYLAYNNIDQAVIEKMYDRSVSSNIYERVPFIPAPAVKYMIDHPADDQNDAQFKRFDYRTVLDNSIVTRLVKTTFFEKLFGPGIKVEQDRKAKLAYR